MDWVKLDHLTWKLTTDAGTFYVRRRGASWRAFRGASEWLRRKTDGTLIIAISAEYCMIAVEDWIRG